MSNDKATVPERASLAVTERNTNNAMRISRKGITKASKTA